MGTCANGHPRQASACPECRVQRGYRLQARRKGLPLCHNGHGMVARNIIGSRENAVCRECGAEPQFPIPPPPPGRHRGNWPGETRCSRDHELPEPGVPCPICAVFRRRGEQGRRGGDPHMPPDTWLDWVIVYDILRGVKPFRAPTRYESLCVLVTVQAKNPHWDSSRVFTWVRSNTVPNLPAVSHVGGLHGWAKAKNLPLLTVEEAMLTQIIPDASLSELEVAV